MVSRLEDLCKIQVAIAHANEFEFKKKFLGLPVFDLDCNQWYSKNYNEEGSWFKDLEEEVSDTLQKFPFALRSKISSHVIILILYRTVKWAKFHEKNFGVPFNYCYYFLRRSFFSSKGMINNEMAARELVKDTKVSLSSRFCMACYYCFSDSITTLWKQLPQDIEPQIDDGKYKHGLGIGGDNSMVVLWSNYFLGKSKKKLDGGLTFSLSKFDLSLRLYNDVSFKSCFEDLNELERNKAVIMCSKFLNTTLDNKISDFFSLQLHSSFQPFLDMILLLLQHLDEKQLNDFFQPPKLLYLVLYHLLSWQYQHVFMKTVKRFSHILSKSAFHLLLHRIVSLMYDELSCKLFDYRLIFNDFWMELPSSCKRFCFRFEGEYNDQDDYFDTDFDDFFTTFTDEEKKDLDIFKEEYKNLEKHTIICELFKLPILTIEDEEIIRLIFRDATLEEKSDIEDLQGGSIMNFSLYVCDLKPIDLFIDCCVPNERVQNFKKEVLNDDYYNNLYFFWKLVIQNKLNQLQKFLNWAFCGEEIKEWQQRLLLENLVPNKVHLYKSECLKYIDKFLEWSLSLAEIKNLKKTLVSSVKNVAEEYKYILLGGDFQKIDFYLNWIFSSEVDIIKFKKDLAFETISHIDDSYVEKGYCHFKKLIKWSALSKEECKDFKRQFAFTDSVIYFYSRYIACRKLYRIDSFIRYAKLTENEVKDFKKLLVFSKQGNVFSGCVYCILNKSSFVRKLLSWCQFSKEEVEEFYSILPDELIDYLYFCEQKPKLVDVKNFFNELPFSEKELKLQKKNFGLKSAGVIQMYVIENKWDEIDEFLNWCFSSKNEISEFKKKIVFETSSLLEHLISSKRYDDVDKFFAWTGIHNSLKKRLLRNSLFDNEDVYEMLVAMYMKENEIGGLLKWLSANDILSNKWKKSFVRWCHENNKNNKCCFYSDCIEYEDIDFPFCHLCGRTSPDLSDFLGLLRTIVIYANKWKDSLKRELEISFNNSTRKSKRSRHF